MHYSRFLLLAFLATLEPIARADRVLVYGEQRLLQEQERVCGKESCGDSRSLLDGTRYKTSVQRERFDARTVISRDNTRRTAADRRSFDRDHQKFSEIRSADDSRLSRERSAERSRELRLVREDTRRDSPDQRIFRNVRQNLRERLLNQVSSERNPSREIQLRKESRKSRRIHAERQNNIKRTTLTQQSREDRIRSRSLEMMQKERGNLNDQRDRKLNNRQSHRANQRISNRDRQNNNRIESRDSRSDRNDDRRQIRDVNKSTRLFRNSDGDRRTGRVTREDGLVRAQSNDRRYSNARVMQESLTTDNERNSESRRVRSTEREDFRQMDRRTVTTVTLTQRMKLDNRQHPNQKYNPETTSLKYLFYTLQGLYICSVLLHLAGIYKNEKQKCGLLQFLTSAAGKVKVE